MQARDAMLRLQGTVELLQYQSGSVEKMKVQVPEAEQSGESTEGEPESDEEDDDFDDA